MPVEIPPEIDQYGFEIGRWMHWLPESPEDEINRLQFNLAWHEVGISFGKRYPHKITDERISDYKRLSELGGKHKSIPTELYLPERRSA